MAANHITEADAVVAVLAYAAQGPEFVFWCEAWLGSTVTVDDTADEVWKHLKALSEGKSAPVLSPAATDLLKRAHFDSELFKVRMAERAHASLMLDSLEAAERNGTPFRVVEVG